MDYAQKRGHAAMLLFSFLVAGSFSLGSLVANMVEPAAINAFRFLIAIVVISTFVIFSPNINKTDVKRLLHAPWRFIIMGGLFAIYFILMFEGLKTSSPISSSIVFTLIPIMSAGFGYFILGQFITKRMVLALLIAFAGALWVIFKADFGALLAFNIGQGEQIFFIGCVAHAIYIPITRKFNWGEKPIISTLGMLIWGCFFLTLVGFNDIINTDWSNLPPIFWFSLFYINIFASATTFFLIQFATLALPSAKVMAYTYLTPCWVILWEVSFGKAWPPSIVFVGVIATLIALMLLLKNEHQKI